MKPTLLLLFTLLLFNTQAAHMMGGYITTQHLTDSTYRIRITIYRDCNSNTQFDGVPGASTPLVVGIYDTIAHNIVSVLHLTSPVVTSISDSFHLGCPGNYCIEQGVYETEITLPGNSTYMVIHQRCCLTAAITSILNTDDSGFALSGLVHANQANSGPLVLLPPLPVIKINDTLVYKNWYTDPDGDSLRFELGEIFSGGSATNPIPDPPTAPPFAYNVWVTGFSAQAPFGNDPVFLDSLTGELRLTPHTKGVYPLNIIINEYRNGSLIGQSPFYSSITVTDCISDVEDVPRDMPGLYPNPTAEVLHLTADVGPLAAVIVYNTVGEAMYTSHTANQSDILTALWPVGMYLVKIIYADNSYTTYRIIKK